MRWAAMLRGINAGVKLPMTDLRKVVEGLGGERVKTLLASGNVVFDTNADGPTIEQRIEEALAARGVKTAALVRDRDEIAAIVAANPFPDAAEAHPNHLLVHFHREPVPSEPIVRVAESYVGPERLAAVGRELFVDYPDDVGHSKLPQAMAKARFPVIATGRNWNTVLKLQALLEG